MLCVEIQQAQYIDLSEIVHVLKAVAIVTSEHLNLSTVFVVSHLLSAKMSPQWMAVESGFWDPEKEPLSPE